MKRWWWPALGVLITASVIYWLDKKQSIDAPSTTTSQTPPATTLPSLQVPPTPVLPASPDLTADTITNPPPKKAGRSFYGDLPEGVESLDELPMINKPSTQWRKLLHSQIQGTSGKALKELEIRPQESYIIMDNGEGRFVERVIMTVRAKDGRFTRFFAEVDSESGHVLKTWGAIIHEHQGH
jgi:hypothetical protein